MNNLTQPNITWEESTDEGALCFSVLRGSKLLMTLRVNNAGEAFDLCSSLANIFGQMAQVVRDAYAPTNEPVATGETSNSGL